MKRLAVAGLALILAAGNASAQTLLFDPFTDDNGTTQTNFTPYLNWNSTGTGFTDYLKNGYLGLQCASAGGGCVDIGGSPGPGYLRTKSSFLFNSGDYIRISFDISGNQRNQATDIFDLNLLFAGNTNYNSVVGTGGYSATNMGPGLASSLGFSVAIAANAAFSNWSMTFQAAQAGSLMYELGGAGADNYGPILDNVLIERVVQSSVVPEPSTYAMLAFGMSAMAVAARRRRKV